MAEIKSVVFVIRTYFKTHTYSSCSVIVDGVYIGHTKASVGTRSVAEEYGMKLLMEKGIISDYKEYEPVFRYWQARDVAYTSEEVPVGKKKDL